MKGRSSKQETKEGMEIDKPGKLKEEPHLSGAYIRSLVKQLTSSRTKDPMNHLKDPDCSTVDSDGFPGENLTKFCETQQAVNQPPQRQHHKKQVRRRLHTSRPYQERLLNMAEARREIVAALKFHRAAMKQASEQQQQQTQNEQQQQQSNKLQCQPPHPCFEKEGNITSGRIPGLYPSGTANFPSYLENLSHPSFSHPPLAQHPFPWPSSSPYDPPSAAENINFPLPNQPLGLNLNLHDFNNLDTSLYKKSNHQSLYASSSPNLSVAATDQDVASVFAISQLEAGTTPPIADVIDSSTVTAGGSRGGLHAAMDDEEMAEIRSIGEQHQMEWNDTMNIVRSAWWFKFWKTMELGAPEVKVEADDDGYHPFDEVMEFPAWLNANESCLQQRLTEDYFDDPALPCMDIGEIEGIDGDQWLA
ncbi:uncharacterized protein LOC121244979 [Juglans microcarpa x Juglans regia]|uniref:uncharacterized protein LOC121244979 n=1 Tax=Juglans microcarpa x Juglans regia TaxID=2249226 RepID=UPI001B7F1031|nr:uncharacterized protein LOC121244979 [Juglans microcarpa x Juglans regia]